MQATSKLPEGGRACVGGGLVPPSKDLPHQAPVSLPHLIAGYCQISCGRCTCPTVARCSCGDLQPPTGKTCRQYKEWGACGQVRAVLVAWIVRLYRVHCPQTLPPSLHRFFCSNGCGSITQTGPVVTARPRVAAARAERTSQARVPCQTEHCCILQCPVMLTALPLFCPLALQYLLCNSATTLRKKSLQLQRQRSSEIRSTGKGTARTVHFKNRTGTGSQCHSKSDPRRLLPTAGQRQRLVAQAPAALTQLLFFLLRLLPLCLSPLCLSRRLLGCHGSIKLAPLGRPGVAVQRHVLRHCERGHHLRRRLPSPCQRRLVQGQCLHHGIGKGPCSAPGHPLAARQVGSSATITPSHSSRNHHTIPPHLELCLLPRQLLLLPPDALQPCLLGRTALVCG